MTFDVDGPEPGRVGGDRRGVSIAITDGEGHQRRPDDPAHRRRPGGDGQHPDHRDSPTRRRVSNVTVEIAPVPGEGTRDNNQATLPGGVHGIEPAVRRRTGVPRTANFLASRGRDILPPCPMTSHRQPASQRWPPEAVAIVALLLRSDPVRKLRKLRGAQTAVLGTSGERDLVTHAEGLEIGSRSCGSWSRRPSSGSSGASRPTRPGSAAASARPR